MVRDLPTLRILPVQLLRPVTPSFFSFSIVHSISELTCTLMGSFYFKLIRNSNSIGDSRSYGFTSGTQSRAIVVLVLTYKSPAATVGMDPIPTTVYLRSVCRLDKVVIHTDLCGVTCFSNITSNINFLNAVVEKFKDLLLLNDFYGLPGVQDILQLKNC